MGRYPSGQRGQTVNLLAYAYAGSNPALPTILILRDLSIISSIRNEWLFLLVDTLGERGVSVGTRSPVFYFTRSISFPQLSIISYFT